MSPLGASTDGAAAAGSFAGAGSVAGACSAAGVSAAGVSEVGATGGAVGEAPVGGKLKLGRLGSAGNPDPPVAGAGALVRFSVYHAKKSLPSLLSSQAIR